MTLPPKKPPKMVCIGDFLDDAQIKQCLKIWEEEVDSSSVTSFHKRVLEEVVQPNLADINRKLGRDNFGPYIAYLIEYVLLEAQRKNGAV